MPANPDHIRRDAEHAARMELSILLERYKRRWYQDAKAHIEIEIAESSGGDAVDGTAIGRAAAARAVAAYGSPRPLPPVESAAVTSTGDTAP